MAEHIIDAFLVTFGLDAKGYKDGVREIDDHSRKLRDESKKTFDGMEQAGKKTGEAIKHVSREVVGLGLAFLGARSITGFLANMATGAASADRFGQTLGMSVKQVWAWRQAMKGFGGQAADADASLQAVQSAKMQYVRGQMGASTQNQWGMLGITGADLQSADAGDILKKLAGSKLAKTNPQFFADSLAQIGLSQPTIYMLMQGRESVDKLITKFEKNSQDAEKAAKDAEALQAEMADLNSKFQKAMIPVLEKILPVLSTIADALTKMTGDSDGAQDTLTGAGAGAVAGFAAGGPIGAIIGAGIGAVDGYGIGRVARGKGKDLLPGSEHGEARIELPSSQPIGGTGSAHNRIMSFLMGRGLSQEQALGITAALHAESGLNPHVDNKQGSGAHGLAQWLSKDRLANFQRMFGHPIKGSNIDEQLQFLWWELKGGDRGGPSVLRQPNARATAGAMVTGFLRPAKGYETNRDLLEASRYISRHGGGSSIHIANMTIHSQATDARGIARDIHGALNRRVTVTQADRVMRP